MTAHAHVSRALLSRRPWPWASHSALHPSSAGQRVPCACHSDPGPHRGTTAGLEVPGLPSPGGGALRPRCAPARVGHLFHWVIILMYRAQRHGFAPPAATDGGGPSSLPAFQWNFPDGRGEARAGHQGPFNEFISQIILPTAQGPQTVGRAWGGAQRQKG